MNLVRRLRVSVLKEQYKIEVDDGPIVGVSQYKLLEILTPYRVKEPAIQQPKKEKSPLEEMLEERLESLVTILREIEAEIRERRKLYHGLLDNLYRQYAEIKNHLLTLEAWPVAGQKAITRQLFAPPAATLCD